MKRSIELLVLFLMLVFFSGCGQKKASTASPTRDPNSQRPTAIGALAGKTAPIASDRSLAASVDGIIASSAGIVLPNLAAMPQSALSLFAGCTPGYNGTVVIPSTLTRLDLAAPPGCSMPIVLYLHGGAWVSGSATDMQGLQPGTNALGMAYASLEYSNGAPMATILYQVRSAVAWIRAYAALLGVDPNRVGLMGVSAGGQLALQEGFTEGVIRWIGSISGPTWMNDLEASDCSNLLDIQAGICRDILWTMGGTPQQAPANYDNFSPINNVQVAEGLTYRPSVYLAHAALDILVPVKEADMLYSGLAERGFNVLYDRVIGNSTIGHGMDANLANYFLVRALLNAAANLSGGWPAAPPKTAPQSPPPPAPVQIKVEDFDGDGKAEIAIFDPNTANWEYRSSKTGQTAITNGFGYSGAISVAADYDGDGKADIAVFDPKGNWAYLSSKTGQTVDINGFGYPGVIPVPADYDGDGKADVAVFDPKTRNMAYISSKTGQTVDINHQ